MPSNPTLPEDVREQVAAMIELVTIVPASLARTDAQEHEVVNDLVDAIAPLLIEWARKDALLGAADDMPAGGMTSQYWDGERVEYATYEVYPRKKGPADWLRERAQFTPETTGGTTNG